MIGLVDYDFYSSTSTTALVPNIEIMKLATYYKGDKNIFCRLIDLDETELSSYDKIYFFSESQKPIEVPPAFRNANNVIFGGTNFTNKYIPFEEEIIDYTIPRPYIYKEILKKKYNDGVKSKIISHTLDDSYYRMYAGNNKLPISPIRAHKRVFIFDKDFFNPNWEDLLYSVVDRTPSSILTVHPIRCKTLTQYFKARNIPRFSRTNTFLIDLDIPLSEVHYMMKHYKNQFLADIVNSSDVCLTLGEDFRYSKQYYENFIYKMNLLFSFWCCKIPIKIKYIYPKIGFTDPLFNISKLVETWTHGETRNTKTLAERTLVTQAGKISPARQERNQILEKYPEVKGLFNQNYETLSHRGYWRV